MFSIRSLYLQGRPTNDFVVGKLLSLVFLVFTSVCCHSQEPERQKNNLVFWELNGAADQGAGIGYERYFQLNRMFRYSLRGGLSYDPEFKYVPMFFGNSFMFGKRHNVEMGLNFMRKYPEIKWDNNYDYNPEQKTAPGNYPTEDFVHRRDIFNFLLGYRYQNEKSGFMVRTFIGTPIKRSQKSFISGPHIGASIGLSF